MGTLNIFILHGWTYSTDKWRPFLDLLRQKGIKATLLKIPGLTEKSDKVWEIDDYVEWLRQKIDDQKVSNLTIKQFNNKFMIIGHSNGGRIALNFALKYPDKLSNLILIDSAGIYHNELIIKIKRLVFGRIAKVGKKLNSSEIFRTLLYKIIGESDYKDATPVMKQTMINLINSDKSLNLNKVSVPTLIIWGREDKTTPLSDGKLMHEQIKKSKLFIVERAKHSPMFTNPEEVAKFIYEYI